MEIPLAWQLLLQLALIVVNAVFASAEIAIVSMNDIKLERLAAQGNKKAKRLVKLTNKPAGFLATIQVAITLSGFLGSAFAADNFSDIIVKWLIGLGVNIKESTLNTIAVVVITIILSYLTLVFGELVPKRIAMKKTEQMALGLSGLIYVSSKIFAPIVWFLTASTNLILKLLRIDPNANEEEVSEEEIRMLIDVGSQKGVIDASEKNMIVNVFEFDDKNCGEISTHRKDIVALDMDDSADEWEKIIKENTLSIYPVFQDSVDNIVALLDAKRYFRIEDKSKENIEKNAFANPVFVSDTMKTDDLFEQMQKSRNHFAVVLDEYGGTVGIVTMNDLLEQIVGDLEDEQTEENSLPDITQIDEKTWKIKGSVSLDTVKNLVGFDLPIEEYETLSGYILGLHCSIPKDKSKFTVETDKLVIDVLNTVNHTVEFAVVALKK